MKLTEINLDNDSEVQRAMDILENLTETTTELDDEEKQDFDENETEEDADEEEGDTYEDSEEGADVYEQSEGESQEELIGEEASEEISTQPTKPVDLPKKGIPQKKGTPPPKKVRSPQPPVKEEVFDEEFEKEVLQKEDEELL